MLVVRKVACFFDEATQNSILDGVRLKFNVLSGLSEFVIC